MQPPWDILIQKLTEFLASWLPRIAGALIVLLVGWGAGRVFGKAISYFLDKIGVDDALRKTSIGKTIEERTKVSLVRSFDIIARWFVYLLAIMAASDILGIERLSTFLQRVVAYLPNLAAGIGIIIIGFIAGDFLGDLIIDVSKRENLEWASAFGNLFKILVYFVIFLIGLRQMMINISLLEDIVRYIVIGVAVGSAVGIGAALGLGLKDVVREYAEKQIMPRITKEKT